MKTKLKEEQKIKGLLNFSKKVFMDASVENGAIVAANTDQPYYPRKAANYHFVWPRDAAFICVAADMLEVNISERFFEWLTVRPEDFVKEGLLFQRYATNGRREGPQFQPDQAGTILWAIHEHYKDRRSDARKHELLIRRLADGLVSDWRGKYFFSNTVDLWEEGRRRTSTKMENNFTYSLAACRRGLLLANEFITNHEWVRVADEMLEEINEAYSVKESYFLRNHGRVSDYNVDASLLGLVFPFDILDSDDMRMVNTVKKIEEKIVVNGGVHRFESDYYDGEGSGFEGGGPWPLLNFWMSIYYSLAGNREAAERYFFWVIDRLEDEFIPEQFLFDFREGVKPLVWSHAMLVLAAKHLGYLDEEKST